MIYHLPPLSENIICHFSWIHLGMIQDFQLELPWRVISFFIHNNFNVGYNLFLTFSTMASWTLLCNKATEVPFLTMYLVKVFPRNYSLNLNTDYVAFHVYQVCTSVHTYLVYLLHRILQKIFSNIIVQVLMLYQV